MVYMDLLQSGELDLYRKNQEPGETRLCGQTEFTDQGYMALSSIATIQKTTLLFDALVCGLIEYLLSNQFKSLILLN